MRNDIGYKELNVRVNVVLREWIVNVLMWETEENQDEAMSDIDYAGKISNIAMALNDIDRKQEALNFLQKALAIQEVVLAKDHPATATSYNNIGLVSYKMGKYQESLSMLKKALAIREAVLEKYHPDTANTYNMIGLVNYKMGKFHEALDMYKRALRIQKWCWARTILNVLPLTIILHWYIIC